MAPVTQEKLFRPVDAGAAGRQHIHGRQAPSVSIPVCKKVFSRALPKEQGDTPVAQFLAHDCLIGHEAQWGIVVVHHLQDIFLQRRVEVQCHVCLHCAPCVC